MKNQVKTWAPADPEKLKVNDVIMHDGAVQTIESIRRDGQQIMQSITTNTHHLSPTANIYTKDLNRI